jgi:hypothetical protein
LARLLPKILARQLFHAENRDGNLSWSFLFEGSIRETTMKNLLSSLKHILMLGIIAIVPQAQAATIFSFTQIGTGLTVTGSADPMTYETTLTATNVLVVVGGIDPSALPLALPFPFVYLNLTATSTGNATPDGLDWTQPFSGHFSFYSSPFEIGTNYLSGAFTDAVFGSGTSLTLSVSDATMGESVVFASDVINPAVLGSPRGLSFSFVDVTPGVSTITNGIDKTTLGSFLASITGNASATPVPVPEPGSLALFGAGLALLGKRHPRRRAAA